MTASSTLILNDGRAIPQIGLGVWQVAGGDTNKVVGAALKAGYRSIDTAAAYRNEQGVGAGIRDSGVARADIFVTTKLWNDGHANARRAFDDSMKRLGLDYLDLYLIHWPSPQQNKFVEAWKTLIALREEGRVKSIGVSNFRAPDLERVIGETGVTPALNQIELHPAFQQRELRAFHEKQGIVTECWSPLGQGAMLKDKTVGALAAKHKRTPAQIVLRWHVQSGFVAIPKSVNPTRIAENFTLFDFALDADDMKTIDALDNQRGRIGPNPGSFG